MGEFGEHVDLTDDLIASVVMGCPRGFSRKRRGFVRGVGCCALARRLPVLARKPLVGSSP